MEGHSQIGLPMQWLYGIDVEFYRKINAYAGTSPLLDKLFHNTEAVGGLLVIFIFCLLWFRPHTDQTFRREILLVGGIALVLALACNRVLSTLLPFRMRPASEIGSAVPISASEGSLERWSSFPSDHGTFYFALAYCFWLASRPLGLAFAIFGAVSSVARIFAGVHYPSDVIVGSLIGWTVAWATNRPLMHRLIGASLLRWERRLPEYFYAALMVSLSEASTGFVNARRIAVVLVHLVQKPP
jgi:undecaprenyl-diphosphatase